MKLLISTNYGVHEYNADTKALRTIFHAFSENLYGLSWDQNNFYVLGRVVPKLAKTNLYRIELKSNKRKKHSLHGITNGHQITAGAYNNLFVTVSCKDAIFEYSQNLKEIRHYHPQNSPTLGVDDTCHINSVLLAKDKSSLHVLGQGSRNRNNFYCQLDLKTNTVKEQINIKGGFACHNIAFDEKIGSFILCADRPFLHNTALLKKYYSNELCIAKDPSQNLFTSSEQGTFFARGLALSDSAIVFGVNQETFSRETFEQDFMKKAKNPLRYQYWVMLQHRLLKKSPGPLKEAIVILNRFRRGKARTATKIAIVDHQFETLRIDHIGNFGDVQEIRIIDEYDHAHNVPPLTAQLATLKWASLRLKLDVLIRNVSRQLTLIKLIFLLLISR